MASRVGAVERAIERAKSSKNVSWAELAEEGDGGAVPWKSRPQTSSNGPPATPKAPDDATESERSD